MTGASTGLLGPTARPMVALGGATAWKTRTIKGIMCSFQWLDLRQHGFENTPDHACVPCMCLFRPGSMARGAYVIPQPHAFLYVPKSGNGLTAHLARSAFSIAEQLGFDIRDKHAIRNAFDIIIEGISDLVSMPSEPPSSDPLVERALLGIEATARMNGKKVYEELL